MYSTKSGAEKGSLLMVKGGEDTKKNWALSCLWIWPEIKRFPGLRELFSNLPHREVEAKNIFASKVSSAELLKTCLELPYFPTRRPFPVFCHCNWWWGNKCPCRFYSNKYVNRRLLLPPFPPQCNIIPLFWKYSYGIFL